MTLDAWIDAMFQHHVAAAIAAGIRNDWPTHALHSGLARAYLDLCRISRAARPNNSEAS